MSSPPEKNSCESTEADLGGPDLHTLDEIFTQLYDKVRRVAARVRWSGDNPTLNPTALAHEAYMKLRKNPPHLAARSNEEVIQLFAHAMHQVLIEAARRKNARKRVTAAVPERSPLPVEDALTVAIAIERLEVENPAQARVLQCLILLGMTADETATALGVSKRTVERHWHDARERLSLTLTSGVESSDD